MPYRLIPDNMSHDTVEALESLLEAAKAGEITGIVFGCTLKKMRYITDMAGFCYTNPTFARGMVAAMDDELAGLVHQREAEETR